jgi:hypothetical protein
MGQSTSNFTWSFWYKQNSVPNGNAVVMGNRSGGSPESLQFIKITPSNFEYYHDGNAGFIPHEIQTGAWQYLAVVKQGAALNYYVDGVLAGASTAAADIEANPFYWGGDPGASGEFADGLIDDVSLWTSALSSNQIQSLWKGVAPSALEGIGGLIATDLRQAMHGVNATAYVRIPFTVDGGAAFSSLKLRMKYEDGFVAYINGVEVARRNAPSETHWNSNATAEHPTTAAVTFEDIDISSHMDALAPGVNILAIQGLNLSPSDPDFLVLPELEATTVAVGKLSYFKNPTPGIDNESGFLGFVADTKFDHDRGFYDVPFEVVVTCATADATIRYTTNGTEPSIVNGFIYTNAIPIGGTTTLRAGAFKPGFETEKTDAQTYLFIDQILAQTGAGLPNNWGRDWQMDPRVVTNAAYASRIRDDMKSLPIVSIALDPMEFWGPSGIYTLASYRGENYERSCSAEMFFADGSRKGFQINCGIQIVGSASRSMTPKHGIGLVFKSIYGPKKLKYRFFEDSDVDEFDSIVFRPNFNMSWVRTDNSGPLNNGNADGAERTHAIYVRDQFTKESQLAMGQVSAHERFVHLYIDGMYWGIYNPSERTDASFAAAYYGGNKADYDAIFSDPSTIARATDGDKNSWNAMMAIANKGLASEASYAQIQQYLDVANLADYMMLNFYCATVDWPWQNWNAARKREAGAQFHFFAWDAEYTLETPPWVPEDRTGVGAGGGEADSPAWLYYRLRQNAEWRLLFADRTHKHFFNNGALTTNQAMLRFEKLCDSIDGAIVGESARWGDVVRKSQPYTRDVEWLAEKNRLLTQFFPHRTARVIQQFINAGLYPNLAAPEFSQMGGLFTNGLVLTINAPSGKIYYTTNGNDPHLPGGSIASDAMVYNGPITLSDSRQIKARVWQTGIWSALNEAVFTVAIEAPSLSVRALGTSVVVYWPLDVKGFLLESSDSLSPPRWEPVPFVVDNRVTNSLDTIRFYRLRKPF